MPPTSAQNIKTIPIPIEQSRTNEFSGPPPSDKSQQINGGGSTATRVRRCQDVVLLILNTHSPRLFYDYAIYFVCWIIVNIGWYVYKKTPAKKPFPMPADRRYFIK